MSPVATESSIDDCAAGGGISMPDQSTRIHGMFCVIGEVLGGIKWLTDLSRVSMLVHSVSRTDKS